MMCSQLSMASWDTHHSSQHIHRAQQQQSPGTSHEKGRVHGASWGARREGERTQHSIHNIRPDAPDAPSGYTDRPRKGKITEQQMVHDRGRNR
jgi:hypothetical protein